MCPSFRLSTSTVGSGGYGTVYKTNDDSMVMKIIPVDNRGREDGTLDIVDNIREFFRKYAKFATDRNVCAVADAKLQECRNEGTPDYYGYTMHTLSPFEPALYTRWERYWAEVGPCVRAMHGRGIVHCDLKVDNIMNANEPAATTGGRGRVIDCDACVMFPKDGREPTCRFVVATARYMHPFMAMFVGALLPADLSDVRLDSPDMCVAIKKFTCVDWIRAVGTHDTALLLQMNAFDGMFKLVWNRDTDTTASLMKIMQFCDLYSLALSFYFASRRGKDVVTALTDFLTHEHDARFLGQTGGRHDPPRHVPARVQRYLRYCRSHPEQLGPPS